MSARTIAAIAAGPWVGISFASGMTQTAGTYPATSRQCLDTIELSGGITGSIGTGGVTVGTLAAAHCPASTVRLSSLSASGTSVDITISTSGVMVANASSSVSSINLDGISFRLV